MTGRRDISDTEINAFLDGELTGTEREQFAMLLDNDEKLRERVADYRKTDELLRWAIGTETSDGLPPRLLAGLTGTGHVHRAFQIRNIAAALVLLVAGAGIGWLGHGLTAGIPAIETGLVNEAQRAHSLYVSEVRHPVEVEAAQYEHLIGWLSKRLDHKLVAPDFSRQGFSLIGGRLLPAADTPAAQFMYQNQSGERITFYVVPNPDSKTTAFRLAEESVVRTFYWLDRPLSYALSGAIDEATLLGLANTAYDQLSKLGGRTTDT